MFGDESVALVQVCYDTFKEHWRIAMICLTSECQIKSKSQFCLADCGPRFGGSHAMKGNYLTLSVDSKLKGLKYEFSFLNSSHFF